MSEQNDWCNLSVSLDFCAMEHIINKLVLKFILDNIYKAKYENELLLASIHVCIYFFYFIIRMGKRQD